MHLKLHLFPYPSIKTCVLEAQKNRLIETVLLSTHNICFDQEIRIMKKVNKQCLLDTPRTVRVSEKTWQVIVRTRRP